MNGTGAILRLSITPLPQRGRGAGGEGGPQRGRGAGGEGSPHRPLLTLGRKMLKSAGRRSLLTCESGQIVLQ